MIKLHPPLLAKLLLTAVLICPILSAKAATLLHLRQDYYLAAAGDIAWHNDIKFKFGEDFENRTYDVGQGISVAVGKICGHWRVELEGAYRKSNLKSISSEFLTEDATGYVRDFALMLNGYWDVYVPNIWWIFYIGGGVGVSFAQRKSCGEITPISLESNTLFAWQGMAGFAYEIVEHCFLNLGYRLFMTARPRTSINHASHIVLINNIELGVRIEL